MATSRNGMVRVTAKTREDATVKLMDAIYRGALRQATHAPNKPKKSGFGATVKSALGLKGSN